MELSLPQQNNAICAFLGGPSTLKQFYRGAREEELLAVGPEDLMFHLSWDWLMPVWKKLRKELMYTDSGSSTLFALSKAIDDADIEVFHKIITNYCVDWCRRKQIKL